MLEDVMRYINNRFDADAHGVPYGSDWGEFSIQDGSLDAGGLSAGEYYWIEGSMLNDGLHLHPAEDLLDETFEGRLVHLRVPNAVVAIADEAEAWIAQNADALNGPYQSESFGGYSYTRASGSVSGNEMPSAAWQVQFGSRLRQWRKLGRDWV